MDDLGQLPEKDEKPAHGGAAGLIGADKLAAPGVAAPRKTPNKS